MALRPLTLWNAVRRQGFAFLALNAYLIIEYIRPQQLVGPLQNLPLGNLTVVLSVFGFVATPKHKFRTSIALWLLLLYVAVILASSFQAYSFDASVAEWKTFALWVVIFICITGIVDTEERFFLFMLAWLLYNYYMSQGASKQFAYRGFRFANWGVKGGVGWFDNSGEFGIEMCLFLPLAFHFVQTVRPYAKGWIRKVILIGAPVTAVLGIVGSSSRGALLGGAAAMGFELVRGGGKRLRVAAATVVLAGLVYVVLPQEQKQRFSEIGTDTTSTRRLTYWKQGLQMAQDYPLLGIGYANWVPYYRSHFIDRSVQVSGALGRVQVSHNIFIQCVAELGYAGLSVFVALIVATFVTNYRTRRLVKAGPGPPSQFMLHMAYGLDAALIGFLVSGFFVTVLYYPYFWINLAFTASLYHIARRQLGERRRAAAAGVPAALPAPALAAVAAGGRRRSSLARPRRRPR